MYKLTHISATLFFSVLMLMGGPQPDNNTNSNPANRSVHNSTVSCAKLGNTNLADKVVFSSTRDGSPDLYAGNPDGSQICQITDDKHTETYAEISPNGKLVVFRSEGNIWTIHSDGTQLKQLTHKGNNTEPDWSPDGSQIAFTSTRDGNTEIYTMNSDGSDQHNISKDKHADSSPRWSPHGLKISFTSNRDGDDEIFVTYPRTNRIHQVTHNNKEDFHAEWSPDGRSFIFISEDWVGIKNLYKTDYRGLKRSKITNFSIGILGSNAYPSWKYLDKHKEYNNVWSAKKYVRGKESIVQLIDKRGSCAVHSSKASDRFSKHNSGYLASNYFF